VTDKLIATQPQAGFYIAGAGQGAPIAALPPHPHPGSHPDRIHFYRKEACKRGLIAPSFWAHLVLE